MTGLLCMALLVLGAAPSVSTAEDGPCIATHGGPGHVPLSAEGQSAPLYMHADSSHAAWQSWVSNNVNVMTSQHAIEEPGQHVLKFWMVDPGVVLQKLVIDAGGLQPSYLGPPESVYQPADQRP